MIIKTTELRKQFTIGHEYVEALRGVDFEADAGDFIVIYGPSGCGKTTLLSLLAGLDLPSSGQVMVRDIDLATLKSDQLASYRRSKIGMVFQQFNLIPTLTAKENIALPLILSGVSRKEASRRAQDLLKIVNLETRSKHKPSEMSGGQQQRVAIARALSCNPWILFVDEPTGNLDVETGEEVIKILRKINSWGRTVVLVTHNPEFVSLGNKVFYMADGKIVKRIQNQNAPARKESDVAGLKYFTASKSLGGMPFWESLRLARNHFMSNKIRTFLTSLGVCLGVGSIVTLVSLGMGLQKITTNQLASLDTLVTINVSANDNSATTLDEKSAKTLSEIQDVSLISPAMSYPIKSTYDNSTASLLLSGINAESLSFEGISLSSGKVFSDMSGVIITKAAAKNFDIKDPSSVIGKPIDIEFYVFSADEKAASGLKTKKVNTQKVITGISSDELVAAVYMPLSELKTISNSEKYNSVKVKVDDRKNVAAVRNQIESLGYTTTSVVDLIQQVDKVFSVTQIILGIIGGVALIVALISIVNIMTISLLERTHEVGTLKAIGATNKDIRRIFEYEVAFFGIVGGVFGVAGSWAFGIFINYVIHYLLVTTKTGTYMNVFVTPINFAIEMIALTIIVSMFAGLYPARRASKLSPLEALRYE
jgi:ABC-type lipoprotein export system ATPase subunit/ABC-type antimicrobial peptide transport system permease subunit